MAPESAKLSFDEKTFRFMMNEDAWATEKLAEGIRFLARGCAAARAGVEAPNWRPLSTSVG